MTEHGTSQDHVNQTSSQDSAIDNISESSFSDDNSQNLSQLASHALRETIKKAVGNIEAPGSAVTDTGSSNVSGQRPTNRKPPTWHSDSSSNTNNYAGPRIKPNKQPEVSSSANIDQTDIHFDNNNLQHSASVQDYSSNNTKMTKSISEENLSKKSKKSNLNESSSSKASQSSEPQNIKSQSENSQNKDSSFFDPVSEPSYDENNPPKLNSAHNQMEAVRQISGTGTNSFSGSDKISGNADSIDSLVNDVTSRFGNRLNSKLDGRSALQSTGISGKPLDNFEPTIQKPNNSSDVSDVANDIRFDIKANTNNTIDHLASVMRKIPDRLSDITPKKQSSSRKHRSSSSSSKKSSSDSNEDKDSSENINNNNRLTWEQLSGLRSFKNLQGVYSLQKCFANAFGYTDDLDGTAIKPKPDAVSQRFRKQLVAHCLELANNGSISKMFEHLRKQEGKTYQAVSDKWAVTRALVQVQHSETAMKLVELLWNLDGTGKHEQNFAELVLALSDKGAEFESLIPENTEIFKKFLEILHNLRQGLVVESEDADNEGSGSSRSSDRARNSSVSSRSNSNSDDDPKPNPGANSRKKNKS